MVDFLSFDDFGYSKNLRQANHMHMHMFCLLVSSEISKIAEIKKYLNFFISSLFLYLADFCPYGT